MAIDRVACAVWRGRVVSGLAGHSASPYDLTRGAITLELLTPVAPVPGTTILNGP